MARFFSSGHSTEIFGYINGIAVVVGLNQENNFSSRVLFVRIRVLERPIQVNAESSFRKPNLGQKMQVFAAVENQFPPEMSAARELTDIYRKSNKAAGWREIYWDSGMSVKN